MQRESLLRVATSTENSIEYATMSFITISSRSGLTTLLQSALEVSRQRTVDVFDFFAINNNSHNR